MDTKYQGSPLPFRLTSELLISILEDLFGGRNGTPKDIIRYLGEAE